LDSCAIVFQARATGMQSVLNGLKEAETIVFDAKENMQEETYRQLCDAILTVYNRAEALQRGDGQDEEGEEDEEEEEEEELMTEDEEEEESDEEQSVERTENDMGLNELSDLWEWQFDFGRRGAVIELDFPIEEIKTSEQPKRVCAAVRVLNRAVRGSNPCDPADAERILEWKEELVAERAIRVCAEILEGVDDRGFENESHEEHWLYSILCDEILELFQRLGEGDALFRTKLRRNGALKAVEAYHATGGGHTTGDVLDMLRLR